MELQLTQPQSEFKLLEAKFPLFVGGYGSGKSMSLIDQALSDMFQYPGGNIGIYCPTYDLMKLNLIPRFEENLAELGLYYKYNRSDYMLEIQGYGKLIFRSMDNPNRIIAYEVFRSHVDEIDLLEENKAQDTWNRIIARNRQKILRPGLSKNQSLVNVKKPFVQNKVKAYTTPESFAFSYKRWKKSPGENYKYVKASTHSNPHLPPDYIDSLYDSYPPHLIDAYINGDWVNLTQGACFPGFDRQLNACKTTIRGREPLIIGQDFNIGKQASVIYVPRGNHLHGVGEIANAFDTEQTLKILEARYPNNPKVMYPDATGKKRSSTSGSVSDFTLIRDAKIRINAPAGNPGVRERIISTNTKICNSREERELFFNIDLCPETVASVEQITFDKNGQMDKKHELDHLVDAATYPVDRMYPIRRRSVTQVHTIGGY
jgi:hypothetical protein